MGGAILCKSHGEIIVLANGDYEELNSKIQYYERITPGKQIKLIDTTSINIDEIIKDQTKINNELSKFFE